MVPDSFFSVFYFIPLHETNGDGPRHQERIQQVMPNDILIKKPESAVTLSTTYTL